MNSSRMGQRPIFTNLQVSKGANTIRTLEASPQTEPPVVSRTHSELPSFWIALPAAILVGRLIGHRLKIFR